MHICMKLLEVRYSARLQVVGCAQAALVAIHMLESMGTLCLFCEKARRIETKPHVCGRTGLLSVKLKSHAVLCSMHALTTELFTLC
jgi:hypothetical protein